MDNLAVMPAVMNVGQRIPSTNDNEFGEVAAAAPSGGLPDDLRVTKTGVFFFLRLDLRFPAIWFLLIIFVAVRLQESSWIMKQLVDKHKFLNHQ